VEVAEIIKTEEAIPVFFCVGRRFTVSKPLKSPVELPTSLVIQGGTKNPSENQAFFDNPRVAHLSTVTR